MTDNKLHEYQAELYALVLNGEVNRRSAREICEKAYGEVSARHIHYVRDVMAELINLGLVVSNGRGFYRPENTEDVKAMAMRLFAHGVAEIRKAKNLMGAQAFDQVRGQLTGL